MIMKRKNLLSRDCIYGLLAADGLHCSLAFAPQVSPALLGLCATHWVQSHR